MDEFASPSAGWTSNGQPILDRDAVQYAGRAARERVLLSICSRCNNELDRRFEKPAKGLIDKMVKAAWVGALSRDEWATLGLWWAKLILLLGLPDARYETSRINHKIVARFDAADRLDLRWLTDGSRVPDELSLYAHRVDSTCDTNHYKIPFPGVVTESNGNQTVFHILSLATQGVGLSLVSHPGWPVEHPLVSVGSAWELLHNPPPSGSDLSLLPAYGPYAIWWQKFTAVLKPGFSLDGTLPPLRATRGLFDPDPQVRGILEGYEF